MVVNTILKKKTRLPFSTFQKWLEAQFFAIKFPLVLRCIAGALDLTKEKKKQHRTLSKMQGEFRLIVIYEGCDKFLLFCKTTKGIAADFGRTARVADN